MKKICVLVFAAFIAVMSLSACGGGGGGGTAGSPSGSGTNNSASTDNSAALVGTWVRSWDITRPAWSGNPSGFNLHCVATLTYSSDGTFLETMSDGGTRAGTYSLNATGVYTEAVTGGAVVETPVPSDGVTVACSDGDHYSKDLGGNQLTWKKLVTVAGSSLTVTTKLLKMNQDVWGFYKLDSSTTTLQDEYPIWKTGQNPGYNQWSMKADGVWAMKGTMSDADGTWSAYDSSSVWTTDASSGTLSIYFSSVTAGSSNMDFTHSSSGMYSFHFVDITETWGKQ